MPRQESVIKRMLDERGVKYGFFCDEMGIPQYAFSKIESGQAEAPTDYYERAARFLQIPTDYLLRLVNAEQPVEAGS